MMEQNGNKLRLYTKKVSGIHYPSALAQSIHMSLITEKGETELRNGYGILFAKGEISDDNVILERGLTNPIICRKDNTIWIYGIYVDSLGNRVGENLYYLWTTTDFVRFEDRGLVDAEVHKEQIEEATDELVLTDEEAIIIRKVWIPHTREDMIKSGQPAGTVFPFPLAEGYADPTLFQWREKWYFLATNDNTDAVGLYLRTAGTVEGLFTPGYEENCILGYDEKRNLIQTFWAPEAHVIGGELYILFAVGGKKWAPQSHMMHLKANGNPMVPQDWEDPVRVLKKDGLPLTEKGITLDMTYLENRGKSYLIWSERYEIGTPYDSGSMLYIAQIMPDKPWVLVSDPILISRPLYGWENQGGTINNEGPYVLKLQDKIYVAYSGGAAGGYSYVIGYLICNAADDPLVPKNWRKTITPVLSAFAAKEQEGPGHNSFFRYDDGILYVAYHAQRPGEDNRRNTAIRQVFLGYEGFPMLDCI